MTLPRPDNVFETEHYASSLWRKVVRSLQLGPRYFLWDVPRYLRHRRAVGLSSWDWGVWLNPLREFWPRISSCFPAPPKLAEALDLCLAAGVRLTIPPHRLAGLVAAWWEARNVPGDVLECGAYRGATSLLLAVLARLNGVEKATIMMDTFTGTPHFSTFDQQRDQLEFRPPPGQVEIIHQAAEVLGVADRIEVFPGLFEDTFPRLLARSRFRLAFVHIDPNTYLGTLEACRLAIPAISPQGVVVFDDYNGVCDLGVRLAAEQYFAGGGTRPCPLAGSSAFVQFPKAI